MTWRLLSPHEAATVEAMTARIIPSDTTPGAREARAVRYIDRALADVDRELAPLYRDGVAELDALCRDRHGRPFAELDDGAQDAILTELDAPPEHEEASAADRLRRFFAIVWEHTIQGTFGDPRHGGNHATVGWRLVGFPGAQWGYSAEEMREGFDARQIPVRTLEALREERLETARGRR
jgi:gluconate 2-dehydrogenase gamma chain